MPSITRNLRMVFQNVEGRLTAITVFDPVPELDAQVIEDTMDHIIDKDIFLSTGGSLTGKVRAEVVERSVDSVYSA